MGQEPFFFPGINFLWNINPQHTTCIFQGKDENLEWGRHEGAALHRLPGTLARAPPLSPHPHLTCGKRPAFSENVREDSSQSSAVRENPLQMATLTATLPHSTPAPHLWLLSTRNWPVQLRN